MAQKEEKRHDRALKDLRGALDFYGRKKGDEPAAFLAVAKAFEVSIEYGWKELKRQLEEKGVEDVFAPKDVVRKAAQVGLIDDAERWLDYIDARNDSVHDYYGMTQADYVQLARAYLKDAAKALG
jgi:nucleotidyltransferase substrate binding protein (TIGR01987 family)